MRGPVMVRGTELLLLDASSGRVLRSSDPSEVGFLTIFPILPVLLRQSLLIGGFLIFNCGARR